MPTDDDELIHARLEAPALRQGKAANATALVRRHYEAIETALMKSRHERKTWEEIGRDLRPADPIAAGTVAKAFKRIAAERDTKAVFHAHANDAAAQEKTAAPSGMPDSGAKPPSKNPFERRIDPVRTAEREA